MKSLILTTVLFLNFVFFSAGSNLFIAVDCFEFADAVEGEAGDSGDFETWSEAFEHCANTQGFETIVITTKKK